jgi:hypothetical protein
MLSNYYWLTYNLKEKYQNIAFIEGIPLNQFGQPDLEQWGGPNGKKIKNEKKPIVEIALGTKTFKKPDFYFMDGLNIIISEYIKKSLEKQLPLNICQFVNLTLHTEKAEENIYVINPLVVADCIIKEKTKYKKRALFEYITHPVLDKNKIPNAPIFLILEHPRIIIVNEEIKDLLIDREGVSIIKIDIE